MNNWRKALSIEEKQRLDLYEEIIQDVAKARNQDPDKVRIEPVITLVHKMARILDGGIGTEYHLNEALEDDTVVSWNLTPPDSNIVDHLVNLYRNIKKRATMEMNISIHEILIDKEIMFWK